MKFTLKGLFVDLGPRRRKERISVAGICYQRTGIYHSPDLFFDTPPLKM